MKRLGVCLDSITLLREKSGDTTLDPVHCIALLELANVDSVVYTLFGTGSKNEVRDLKILRDCIHSHFNLRIEPSEQTVQLAIHAKAEMVTLLQASEHSITSIDLTAAEDYLSQLVTSLRNQGIVVNALIEPDATQIKAAVRIGADYVDLHAQRFIRADSMALMEQEVDNLKSMTAAAAKLKLGVSMTGDFSLQSLREVSAFEELEEINIGYSTFGRAVMLGIEPAVREMMNALKNQ